MCQLGKETSPNDEFGNTEAAGDHVTGLATGDHVTGLAAGDHVAGLMRWWVGYTRPVGSAQRPCTRAREYKCPVGPQMHQRGQTHQWDHKLLVGP
eukprot:1138474-Pelagomonas_calceolata.AAC.3